MWTFIQTEWAHIRCYHSVLLWDVSSANCQVNCGRTPPCLDRNLFSPPARPWCLRRPWQTLALIVSDIRQDDYCLIPVSTGAHSTSQRIDYSPCSASFPLITLLFSSLWRRWMAMSVDHDWLVDAWSGPCAYSCLSDTQGWALLELRSLWLPQTSPLSSKEASRWKTLIRQSEEFCLGGGTEWSLVKH